MTKNELKDKVYELIKEVDDEGNGVTRVLIECIPNEDLDRVIKYIEDGKVSEPIGVLLMAREFMKELVEATEREEMDVKGFKVDMKEDFVEKIGYIDCANKDAIDLIPEKNIQGFIKGVQMGLIKKEEAVTLALMVFTQLTGGSDV